VKDTVIEQLPLAATDVPQLFVSLKSPAFVPVMATFETVSGPLPPLLKVKEGFVTVVPTGVLLKTWLFVESEACATPTPVPLRDTLCVEPAAPLALSVTVRVALNVDALCGSNVTEIVHDPDAATEVPQLFVCAKDPPAMAMPERLSGAVPPFANVTVIGELVVFTVWLVKDREL
jgi:hypothetical protein